MENRSFMNVIKDFFTKNVGYKFLALALAVFVFVIINL